MQHPGRKGSSCVSSNDQEPQSGQSSQPSQSEQPEQTERRKPTSELWGPWVVPGENGQAPDYRVASGTQFKKPGEQDAPADAEYMGVDAQFPYREHVSGPLAPHAASGRNSLRPYIAPAPPLQAPGYPPPGIGYPPVPYYAGQSQGYPPIQSYPPTPSYQGYASWPPNQPSQAGSPVPPGYAPYAYPGYPYPYPYPYVPPKPRRDGYLFGVGIASFIGSILVILAGLISLLLLSFLPAVSSDTLSSSQKFMGAVTFVAFALVGLIGGGFALYHSIRSVFAQKPSADFAMPTFWLFVALYVVVIGVGYVLHMQGQDIANLQLTAVLILLAGLFPALAVLALGDRRLRFPKGARWPTSWRRFTLAIVSGATMGVLVAGLLELAFQVLLVRGQGVDPYLCLNRPDAPACQDPKVYNLLLIAVAVIAPLVEEAVKPLGVIILIGRVRSAAEAFVLGLACGIGFDLIETSGYISANYNDWLSTALIRTGAGLLHGFGAAMVALGWYYLVHAKKRRLLLAFLCWFYAVLQHALWNGSWGLVLIPGPIGNYFNNASVTLGPFSVPAYEIINIVEALFMLAFFLYMTGRLRTSIPSSPPPDSRSGASEPGQREVVRT